MDLRNRRMEPIRSTRSGYPSAARAYSTASSIVIAFPSSQAEYFVVKLEIAGGAGGRFEGAAGGVEGLMQVVGGGSGVVIGPEERHQLLPVPLMPRREREEFDERARLAQSPLRGSMALSPTQIRKSPRSCMRSSWGASVIVCLAIGQALLSLQTS